MLGRLAFLLQEQHLVFYSFWHANSPFVGKKMWQHVDHIDAHFCNTNPLYNDQSVVKQSAYNGSNTLFQAYEQKPQHR